ELAKNPNDKKLKTKINDAENSLRVAKEAEIKLNSAKKAVDASQEPSIIKELQVNIQESAAPLVAGFYLDISDGQGIKLKKRWHFGDGEERINNNLVQNHTYHNKGKFTMWVDIVDERLRVIERSKKIEFDVGKKLDKFNFDQWEGVIVEGDKVGFSLGGDIQGEDKIKWVWGDGKELENDTNPHHKYEKAGKYSGDISVGIHSRKFGMLVLSDRLRHIAGKIEVADATESSKGFPAKEKLTLQVQLTGGTPEYHVVWKFGDGCGGAGTMTEHAYKEKGSYQISCTVRDQNALTFYFEKNITIV
ncbi:MAG: PKD domain-containing protein, partial [Thaumarchaeota archaeon]|nr:PKD domain-containing protein [Nitrososphaerota archaeon]